MPRSQQPPEGEQIIVEKILAYPKQWVLDVGCGDWKWSKYLFKKVSQLHGVEICKDYIDKYNLITKYDEIYHCDICDFKRFFLFDVVILGDVFEHLEHDRAIELIDTLKNYILTVFLTIPISKCVQNGKVYGNPYETHRYQWAHEELIVLGFKQLHEGFNENGLVKIGTYEMLCGT